LDGICSRQEKSTPHPINVSIHRVEEVEECDRNGKTAAMMTTVATTTMTTTLVATLTAATADGAGNDGNIWKPTAMTATATQQST
jgi:hypothetical protein